MTLLIRINKKNGIGIAWPLVWRYVRKREGRGGAITGFEEEIRVDSTMFLVVKKTFRVCRKKLQKAVYSEQEPLVFWLKGEGGAICFQWTLSWDSPSSCHRGRDLEMEENAALWWVYKCTGLSSMARTNVAFADPQLISTHSWIYWLGYTLFGQALEEGLSTTEQLDILSLFYMTSEEPSGKGLDVVHPVASSDLALILKILCREPAPELFPALRCVLEPFPFFFFYLYR